MARWQGGEASGSCCGGSQAMSWGKWLSPQYKLQDLDVGQAVQPGHTTKPFAPHQAPADMVRSFAWLPESMDTLQNRFLCLWQGCVGVFTNFPPLPSSRILWTCMSCLLLVRARSWRPTLPAHPDKSWQSPCSKARVFKSEPVGGDD